MQQKKKKKCTQKSENLKLPKRVLTADTSSGIIAMNVETKGMEGSGRGRGGREKGRNRNREQIIAPSVKN